MTKRCGGENISTRSLSRAIRPEDEKPKEAEINGNDEAKVEEKAKLRAAVAASSSAAAATADDLDEEDEEEEGKRTVKKCKIPRSRAKKMCVCTT